MKKFKFACKRITFERLIIANVGTKRQNKGWAIGGRTYVRGIDENLGNMFLNVLVNTKNFTFLIILSFSLGCPLDSRQNIKPEYLYTFIQYTMSSETPIFYFFQVYLRRSPVEFPTSHILNVWKSWRVLRGVGWIAREEILLRNLECDIICYINMCVG